MHPCRSINLGCRKRNGARLPIEGNVDASDRVVVDDVIITGGSTLKVIEACRDASLVVGDCCVLVDRQEGAATRSRPMGDRSQPWLPAKRR